MNALLVSLNGQPGCTPIAYKGPGEIPPLHGNCLAEIGNRILFCRIIRPANVKNTKGAFLRLETEDDTSRRETNEKLAKAAMHVFDTENQGAVFNPHAVAATFDYERKNLILFFSADKPYDTKRSVISLKRRYAAEVEIKQIGIRDEFSALGAIGPCGRVCCCATGIFSSGIQNVNLKMAKAQNVSLNPVNLNGQCERIKCCVAFEME